MTTGNGERDRVRANTEPEILRHIDEDTKARIAYYANEPKEAISRRIRELDEEWDMERWLETNASSVAFTSLALGIFVNRKWLFLTATVLGFLFQHATQGWCPPVPVLRRMGVRTQSEIDREKLAMKILRGDFQQLPGDPERWKTQPPSELWNVVRA